MKRNTLSLRGILYIFCYLFSVQLCACSVPNTIKKVIKGATILVGCYVIFKEASYVYQCCIYEKEKLDREATTVLLLNEKKIPSPTMAEVVKKHTTMANLKETVLAKKQETFLCKYIPYPFD